MRGRLLGQLFQNGKLQLGVVQSYDFQNNDAFSTGSQSFEAALDATQKLSSKTRVWLLGWGGLTVLGAVDSLPVDVTQPPEEDPGAESPSQGISEGPRF